MLGATPAAGPARAERWVLYGMAVGCVAVAVTLPAAIEPIVGSQSSLITLLIFTLAVGFASTAGGLAAGSTALLLGAIWFFLVARHYSPAVTDTGAYVVLGIYALIAGGIAVLAASRRSADADVANFDDSTERRNLAELPRGRGERYRTPPDEANDSAVYMLSPEGRLATWNKGIGRMLGYERIEYRHLTQELETSVSCLRE